MRSHQLYMEESFVVKRRQADCFRYITDFSTIAEWDHTVVSSSKLTDGPVQLGTEFDVCLKFGVRKVPMTYKITQYEAPGFAVLEGKADNFIATDTITVEEISENECKVTWKADITFTGFMSRFVSAFESTIQKNGRKTIDGLRTALEDQNPTPKRYTSYDIADKLIFPGLYLFSKYGYKNARKKWHPMSASMADKHVVITGATSGIGEAAAYELAHKGARLTLVARNEAKARAIKDAIDQSFGSFATFI